MLFRSAEYSIAIESSELCQFVAGARRVVFDVAVFGWDTSFPNLDVDISCALQAFENNMVQENLHGPGDIIWIEKVLLQWLWHTRNLGHDNLALLHSLVVDYFDVADRPDRVEPPRATLVVDQRLFHHDGHNALATSCEWNGSEVYELSSLNVTWGSLLTPNGIHSD